MSFALDSLILSLVAWIAAPLTAFVFFRAMAAGPRTANAALRPLIEPAFASREIAFLGAPPQARLARSSKDLDAFASDMLRMWPEATVLRNPGVFNFPSFVCASPSAGICFELIPLAIDPRGEASLDLALLKTGAAPGVYFSESCATTRLCRFATDLEAFALEIVGSRLEASTTRMEPFALFPVLVAAIPREGLSFELTALSPTFDPLALACSFEAETIALDLPAPAPIAGGRRARRM